MHNLVSITPKENSLTVRDATVTIDGSAAYCRLRLVNSHVALVNSENVVIEGLENSSVSARNSEFHIAQYSPHEGDGISLVETHKCSVRLSGDVFSHVIADECQTVVENGENMSIVVLGGVLSGHGGDTVRVFVDGGNIEGEFSQVEGIVNGVKTNEDTPASAPVSAPDAAPENEPTQAEEPTEIIDNESVSAREDGDVEVAEDDAAVPNGAPNVAPVDTPIGAPDDAPTNTPQEHYEDSDLIYTDVDGFTYKTLNPHKLGIHHTTTYATDEQLEASAPANAPAITPTTTPDNAPEVTPFDITPKKTTKITLPWNNL